MEFHHAKYEVPVGLAFSFKKGRTAQLFHTPLSITVTLAPLTLFCRLKYNRFFSEVTFHTNVNFALCF